MFGKYILTRTSLHLFLCICIGLCEHIEREGTTLRLKLMLIVKYTLVTHQILWAEGLTTENGNWTHTFGSRLTTLTTVPNCRQLVIVIN